MSKKNNLPPTHEDAQNELIAARGNTSQIEKYGYFTAIDSQLHGDELLAKLAQAQYASYQSFSSEKLDPHTADGASVFYTTDGKMGIRLVVNGVNIHAEN